jgi:nucleoside-diphosphate-sugar epimerase
VRILFTGASSFTGFWFVRELARAGHEVWATFRKGPDEYEGIRQIRVRELQEVCRPLHGCCFGSSGFLDQIAGQQQWDLLCHHAAEVSDYKSPDFDVAAAVAANSANLAAVLEALQSRGCQKVVLTGSVFEQNEGAGSDGLPAFSPYGLSKGLTAEIFRYYTARHELRLGKFVIPNPFGAYEEPRFTAYLVRTWRAGQRAAVNTPAYVRDNIHVSLLARAYLRFVEQLGAAPGSEKINPSGYVETQGAFARRFAAEMAPRLGLACELEFKRQTEFTEARVRINTDPVVPMETEWSEQQAWDELAAYYRELPTA